MKKITLILYIILFLAVCGAPLLTMALGVRPPNYEKRALANMPSLITKERLNLDFPKEFSAYFSANFGLRPYYVTAYTSLIYYGLNDSVNEQVIAGKNGWLFYGPTLKDYTATSLLTKQEIDSIVKMLKLQDEYLSSLGIQFIFTVAPNKASIYGEHMSARYPARARPNNLSNLSRALENETINYVDLLGPLRAAKTEQQVYHALDTHWNNTGALVVVHALLGKVQESIPEYIYVDYSDIESNIEQSWLGDLSVMLLPALKLKELQAVYDIPENFTFKEKGRLSKRGRNLEAMRIETSSKINNTSLLMFRDSFANALIPFLSNNFRDAHYTRAVPYNYTYIDSLSPDVVILEIAERNIPNLIKYAPVMK